MKKGDKAAIVCCSNGQAVSQKEKIEKLQQVLSEIGIETVLGDYVFVKESVWSGSAQERAGELMRFYKNPEITAIFDISGGDMANEILPYLDFEVIATNPKEFWGYSDLTTIVNAIYSQTGNTSVWYQVRNLISRDGPQQIADFRQTMLEKKKSLYDFSYSFAQKQNMQGIVVGGNIRCLLKLAGTKYWPDMNGKILFLEARSGTLPLMITFFSQLKQLGVFEQIVGLLLGTFLEMEEKQCMPTIVELAKQYVGPEMPIACTSEVGHRTSSKAIRIGETMEFRMSNYEIAKLQTEKEFLKYDQQKILKKFPLLKNNEDYLFIDFLCRTYRIDRRSGKVCWSVDDFSHVMEADYNEAMTIYDVLCYSKDERQLSGEWVNMQSLSTIKGSSGSVGDSIYRDEGMFFDGKETDLARACEKLGGVKAGKGDVAYEIPIFDFLSFRIQFWSSDEEFEASIQLFMDKNITQYMHYETIWYAVGHLLRRIKEEML